MSARCLFIVIVPKSTLGGDVCCILTLKLRSYNKHDKLKKYFGNENANVQWENCAKQWRHNVGFDQACMVTAAALVQWDRGSTGSSIQSGQYDRMRVTLTQHTASAWPVMGPRLSALPMPWPRPAPCRMTTRDNPWTGSWPDRPPSDRPTIDICRIRDDPCYTLTPRCFVAKSSVVIPYQKFQAWLIIASTKHLLWTHFLNVSNVTRGVWSWSLSC